MLPGLIQVRDELLAGVRHLGRGCRSSPLTSLQTPLQTPLAKLVFSKATYHLNHLSIPRLLARAPRIQYSAGRKSRKTQLQMKALKHAAEIIPAKAKAPNCKQRWWSEAHQGLQRLCLRANAARQKTSAIFLQCPAEERCR